ncbi:MAG TPA: spore coat U domain-containing protein [Gammaproteobacteria bacterium]
MNKISRLAGIVLLGCSGAAAAECSINVTGTNFGLYQPFDYAPTDSSGDITINCSPDITYNIKLDTGNAVSFIPRQLKSGTATLEYNLYRDVSYNEVWGDGMGGTYTRSGPGTGSNEILKIFGRIPTGQNVAEGIYTDTVGVLVEY